MIVCTPRCRRVRSPAVPGAFLIGNWQSNTKGLAALTASHPNVSSVGNDRCWQHWNTDAGGRKWLRQALPSGFDAQRQLLVFFC